MNKIFFFTILFIISLNSFSFNEKNFPVIKFSNFLASEKLKDCKDVKSDRNISIDARMPGFSAHLVYTGKVRSISKKRLQLLKHFSTMINRKMHEDYKREIQVSESGMNYWLPIQEVTFDSFKKVAKASDEIEVFNRKLGCIFEENQPSIISIIISVRTK